MGRRRICLCLLRNGFAKIKIISEQLREHISQAEFESIGHLTCSIGLTEVQTNDTDQAVFDRADKAMYEAKLNGRNCVIAK